VHDRLHTLLLGHHIQMRGLARESTCARAHSTTGPSSLGLVRLFPIHMDWMGLEKIEKKFNLFGIQTHPIHSIHMD
jgi:hypothetical protein